MIIILIIVMDEFHYYSDRDRGVAWQVPLLIMRKTRFLLVVAAAVARKPERYAVGASSCCTTSKDHRSLWLLTGPWVPCAR